MTQTYYENRFPCYGKCERILLFVIGFPNKELDIIVIAKAKIVFKQMIVLTSKLKLEFRSFSDICIEYRIVCA